MTAGAQLREVSVGTSVSNPIRHKMAKRDTYIEQATSVTYEGNGMRNGDISKMSSHHSQSG